MDNRPRAIYIIGGAGSGKSFFMERLLEEIGAELGPLEGFHSLPHRRPGTKARVTLRGHSFESGIGPGLYLGHFREKHPGTDGLDLVTNPVAVNWVEEGEVLGTLPPRLVSEGAVLMTKNFFSALALAYDLLVVHITVDYMIRELRFESRGSNQGETFVRGTITRSKNMAKFAADLPGSPRVVEFDSELPEELDRTLKICREHLGGADD